MSGYHNTYASPAVGVARPSPHQFSAQTMPGPSVTPPVAATYSPIPVAGSVPPTPAPSSAACRSVGSARSGIPEPAIGGPRTVTPIVWYRRGVRRHGGASVASSVASGLSQSRHRPGTIDTGVSTRLNTAASTAAAAAATAAAAPVRNPSIEPVPVPDFLPIVSPSPYISAAMQRAARDDSPSPEPAMPSLHAPRGLLRQAAAATGAVALAMLAWACLDAWTGYSLPCWVGLSGGWGVDEFRQKLEPEGVSLCEFAGDLRAAELELVQQLSLRAVHGNAGILKEKLEKLLEGALYGSGGGGEAATAEMRVPQEHFWMLYEQLIITSRYIKLSSSTVGLAAKPSLLSWATLHCSSSVLLVILWGLLRQASVVVAAVGGAALFFKLCVQGPLERRRRRRSALVQLLISTAYNELQLLRGECSMLQLRRMCVAALRNRASQADIESLWPCPGEPDGPIEAALRNDSDDGILLRETKRGDGTVTLMARIRDTPRPYEGAQQPGTPYSTRPPPSLPSVSAPAGFVRMRVQALPPPAAFLPAEQ